MRYAWGHTALAAFRGGRGGSENGFRVWPRQLQCGRSAKCRHRINYQSIDNWLLSRITARPDALRSVDRFLRDSSGRISGLSPGRKRVCPDYAGVRPPVILRHQMRKRGHVLRAEASALCRPSAQCARGTTTLNNAALPSNRFFASMQPARRRAGCSQRAQQKPLAASTACADPRPAPSKVPGWSTHAHRRDCHASARVKAGFQFRCGRDHAADRAIRPIAHHRTMTALLVSESPETAQLIRAIIRMIWGYRVARTAQYTFFERYRIYDN